MKQFILPAFFASVISTTSGAQIAVAPELGLNMSEMSMKVTNLASGSFTYNTGFKAGVAIGAIADIGITGSIYFQPGVFYEMTGTHFTASDVQPGGRWDINTIEIPLNFEYKTGEKGGNRFFVGIGPYIGYNISASYNYDANNTYNYYASSGSLKVGSTRPDPTTGASGDDIKPLDIGAGINVGYQLANGFYARAHYQMGFTNLDPYSDAYDAYKTMAIGVTVGYYFSGQSGKKAGAPYSR